MARQASEVDHQRIGLVVADVFGECGKRHVIVFDFETTGAAGFDERPGFGWSPVNDADTRHYMTE